MVVVVPSTLDDATRDVNVVCSQALGKGECTITTGWLLHSDEWTVTAGELVGASYSCNEDACFGTLDLLGGTEALGRIDKDSFRVFSDEIDSFLDDPSQSTLDATLGPARMAWMMFAAVFGVSLVLLGTFEYSELKVDRGARILRIRTRSLLRWGDEEFAFDDIVRVRVESLPRKNEREAPDSIVWLQVHNGPDVRVGRSNDVAADGLANWIRDRAQLRNVGRIS
jgi:hypothetical protein